MFAKVCVRECAEIFFFFVSAFSRHTLHLVARRCFFCTACVCVFMGVFVMQVYVREREVKSACVCVCVWINKAIAVIS